MRTRTWKPISLLQIHPLMTVIERRVIEKRCSLEIWCASCGKCKLCLDPTLHLSPFSSWQSRFCTCKGRTYYQTNSRIWNKKKIYWSGSGGLHCKFAVKAFFKYTDSCISLVFETQQNAKKGRNPLYWCKRYGKTD